MQDWNVTMANEVSFEGAQVQDQNLSAHKNYGPGEVKKSWASVLGCNIPTRDDNNVLEIVLEKDIKGSFNVTDLECCHLLKKLGLDTRPGVHVEQVQICPQGRGVIYITLKKDLQIIRYCRYEVFEVNRTGTRAVLVKEAVVTIKGLHPNTRDEVVLDY